MTRCSATLTTGTLRNLIITIPPALGADLELRELVELQIGSNRLMR